jgi:serine/threonine-protein kinase RsbW
VRTTTLNRHYRDAFPCEIHNLAFARRGIAAFAAVCGFSDEEVSDIRLAAGEALSNAVEHGSGRRSRKIVVDCSFDGRRLAIEIRDTGSGFPEPSDRSSVEPNDRGRGFGIFLMRRLMDEVSFARNGTVVRLTRSRA